MDGMKKSKDIQNSIKLLQAILSAEYKERLLKEA